MVDKSTPSKNWIDPFEGIETVFSFFSSYTRTFESKNWIDPFEGIETLLWLGKIGDIIRKNWIDPFEGIETSPNFLTFQAKSIGKSWIDPFEGIETLPRLQKKKGQTN